MMQKFLGKEWAYHLEGRLSPAKFKVLGEKIKELRQTFTIYPSKENVFKAFHLTPFDEVKVVLIGQDPYHDGSADGLAFSASLNTLKCPPSLKNILGEIERSYPQNSARLDYGSLDPWDLSRWARQGVFLTNTAYTVQRSKPGSHVVYWKPFFKEVVKTINEHRQDVVWLLLGNEAKEFKFFITNPSHAVVEAAHPAADLYRKESLFYGSGCFEKVNEELSARNIKEIIW